MSTGDFPDINLSGELKQRTMDFYWKKQPKNTIEYNYTRPYKLSPNAQFFEKGNMSDLLEAASNNDEYGSVLWKEKNLPKMSWQEYKEYTQPTNRAEQVILDELDAPTISKAGPFLNSDLTDVVWPENRNNTTGENLWTPEENNIKEYTRTTYTDLVVEKPKIKPQYLFAVFNELDGIPRIFVTLNTISRPQLTCNCYSKDTYNNCVHIRTITGMLYIDLLNNDTLNVICYAVEVNSIIELLNTKNIPLINYLPYRVITCVYLGYLKNINNTDTSIGIDDYKKSRNINIKGQA